MRWLSRLTTLSLLAALAVGGAVVVWPKVRPPRVGGGYHTYAHFRDALGLPIGSRVVIAGVVVGEIESLTVEGNQARIGMRLRDDVVLWDDAFATRKASSVLSDNYVELSPGGPDASDPESAARPHRRLRSGEPIPRVIEAATTDRVLRGLERAVPRVEGTLVGAREDVDRAREWTNGELPRMLAAIDRQLEADVVGRKLAAIDEASERVDRGTARVAELVAESLPTVDRGLDDLTRQTADATTRLRSATADIKSELATVRDQLDRADDAAARVRDVLDAVDGEKSGALGRLIDDPEPGLTIADYAEAGADAAAGLDRLKTALGFRTELNLLARSPRFYVSAEIAARGDQFYLVELEKGFEGDVPAIELVERPGGGFVRTALIREAIRFTAQWGKRVGPISVRLGLRDSAFGAGLDASLFGGRLKLAADLTEPTLARLPRIKLAAALEVFRSIYVLGGIDDVMTRGAALQIAPWDPSADVPIQFQELRFGRDYFLGVNLAFKDTDINTLLRIYGGLVAALVR